MPPSCRLDHLVLACDDLAQGRRFVLEQLGVEAQPGGKHVAMGTHNALVGLGPRTYLELIAIDPEGSAQRPRWFGLDTPAMRARTARAPCLATWVARCNDLAGAAARVPALGTIHALSRGKFRWRIAFPDDGSLRFGGVLPTLIEWEGDAHPAAGLPAAGCELLRLSLSHPQAAELATLFRELGIEGPLELSDGPLGLAAEIRSPRGTVVLR